MIRELQTADGRTLYVIAVLPEPHGGRRYCCAESLCWARIARSRVRDEGVDVLERLDGLVSVDAVVR